MPAQNNKPQLNTEQLRARLTIRNATAEKRLRKNSPEASSFFDKIGLRPGRIRDHAAKLITSGVLSGSLLLSAHSAVPQANEKQAQVRNKQIAEVTNDQVLNEQMKDFLKSKLPETGKWELGKDLETQISQKIKEVYGVNATAELEGKRLNHQYGRMGAEQHLPRFPGDSAGQHEELIDKGITPGKGAWGYFAYSKNDMTPELYETEKWYVAVQTLYLPDWNTNFKELRDWYKYRRVAVVNPENGKMVIAAVADAGPAQWTGKHFGGSPELMKYLGIDYGKQNHPVVLFFVDDPDKKLNLGPVEYNIEEYKKLTQNTV